MTDRKRIFGFWRIVFLALVAGGLTVGYMRWTSGLGSVTNLSDDYPWGLWVGFDILCGIGLAAGGFMITAVVFLFRLERFRPIVRPALMTAFLGYMLEVVALMFDLGRPWNLWRPLTTWNPDSVMYVVAWCVTVYSLVLMLELSGALFERVGWSRAARIQRKVTVPLVVVGVILSIIHQSSLGALYLIVPHKLHALWYSSNLPVLFLVSSVMVGLAMIIVESRLSGRAFKHQLDGKLLTELGGALLVMLGIYGLARLTDLAWRGALPQVVAFDRESQLFIGEFALGVVLPMIMLASPARRMNMRLLYGASMLTVLGFVLNRLNVSMTAFEASRGHAYIPTVAEFVVTLMLCALGFAGFTIAARYLRMFHHPKGAAGGSPH